MIAEIHALATALADRRFAARAVVVEYRETWFNDGRTDLIHGDVVQLRAILDDGITYAERRLWWSARSCWGPWQDRGEHAGGVGSIDCFLTPCRLVEMAEADASPDDRGDMPVRTMGPPSVAPFMVPIDQDGDPLVFIYPPSRDWPECPACGPTTNDDDGCCVGCGADVAYVCAWDPEGWADAVASANTSRSERQAGRDHADYDATAADIDGLEVTPSLLDAFEGLVETIELFWDRAEAENGPSLSRNEIRAAVAKLRTAVAEARPVARGADLPERDVFGIQDHEGAEGEDAGGTGGRGEG